MKQKNGTGPFIPLEVPPDIGKTGILVGTSGYHFDDWVGLFNPPGVPAAKRALLSEEARQDQDRLLFYQKYFSFVEINHTFYQEPALQSFLDIERRSKVSMQYAVKVFRDISHTKTWDGPRARNLMQKHVQAVSPLIETGRFYSFLIQLEDHVERSNKAMDYLLFASEGATEAKTDVHIEFRHVTWHSERVLQSLKDHNIGICNTEIPHFPHTFPLKSYATTDKGYIRYSGLNAENWYPKGPKLTAKDRINARNARYDYDYSPEELKIRLEGQLKLIRKTSRTAVAFNNHFQIKAILNAIRNIRFIQERFQLPGKESPSV